MKTTTCLIGAIAILVGSYGVANFERWSTVDRQTHRSARLRNPLDPLPPGVSAWNWGPFRGAKWQMRIDPATGRQVRVRIDESKLGGSVMPAQWLDDNYENHPAIRP